MASTSSRQIGELLTLAASHVKFVPKREPWDNGWSDAEYRRSAHAAIWTPEGPATITGEGLDAWEDAVSRLLKEARILERWDQEQIWGILASMVATAASAEDPAEFIDNKLSKLRTVGPELTIILVANAVWDSSPMVLGDVVIGNASEEFLKLVNKIAGKRAKATDTQAEEWLNSVVTPRQAEATDTAPVAIASWSTGQGELAFGDAERKLRNLTDLSLFLERDLVGQAIYRRGPTNRPGIRGLTLDRGAVERGLSGPSRLELLAQPLSASNIFRPKQSTHWYGSEPFPLGTLLGQDYLRTAVESCLRNDPISNRIRVGARWFAEAQYSSADDDAALALGVAMDALLTGQRALPGSAMADRYALLAREAERRRELVSDYLSFYSVRSSVAHGGKSSKLDHDDFMAGYIAAAQWAAWRLVDLRDTFTPSSEKDVDSVFDDLRWGIRIWPSGN